MQNQVVSHAVGRNVADGLALAVAPTFAAMALLTAVSGSDAASMLCGAAGGFVLAGMAPMYLLMSAFHLAPWLRLRARQREWGRSCQSTNQ